MQALPDYSLLLRLRRLADQAALTIGCRIFALAALRSPFRLGRLGRLGKLRFHL